NVPVHDWQIAELDRRRQRLLGDPTAAIPWDELDRQLRLRALSSSAAQKVSLRGLLLVR
ncbi:MAG: hypothetical protein B7Z73_19060, partial [Planctomycetia bacterium 21-64-5]